MLYFPSANLSLELEHLADDIRHCFVGQSETFKELRQSKEWMNWSEYIQIKMTNDGLSVRVVPDWLGNNSAPKQLGQLLRGWSYEKMAKVFLEMKAKAEAMKPKYIGDLTAIEKGTVVQYWVTKNDHWGQQKFAQGTRLVASLPVFSDVFERSWQSLHMGEHSGHLTDGKYRKLTSWIFVNPETGEDVEISSNICMLDGETVLTPGNEKYAPRLLFRTPSVYYHDGDIVRIKEEFLGDYAYWDIPEKFNEYVVHDMFGQLGDYPDMEPKWVVRLRCTNPAYKDLYLGQVETHHLETVKRGALWCLRNWNEENRKIFNSFSFEEKIWAAKQTNLFYTPINPETGHYGYSVSKFNEYAKDENLNMLFGNTPLFVTDEKPTSFQPSCASKLAMEMIPELVQECREKLLSAIEKESQ